MKTILVIFIFACMTLLLPSCMVYGGYGYHHRNDRDFHNRGEYFDDRHRNFYDHRDFDEHY